MRKFIKYILETVIICAVMIFLTFYGVVAYPKNVFGTSYQSAIQDKFRILKETDEPKIIIIGGSNAAFGIDQQMLEEATGYKVVNMGLHAGFNHIFYSELAKANINPGDIVLLAYEYNWYEQSAFNTIGTELVMSAIDSNLEMYQYIPLKSWPSILGYLGTYAYKKNTFEPAEGQYSRSAFDSETGQMIFTRDYIADDYRDKPEPRDTVDLNDIVISDKTIRYLKKYNTFIESKGAKAYFISPPLLREAITCEADAFTRLTHLEEELIGIPYISDPKNYMYPETLMSNSIYHCNNRGEEERTRQLINDLHTAGVVEIKNIKNYQQSKDNQILFEYDIVKYLEAIRDPRYTIFISAKGEATGALTEEIMAKLRKLGLKTDLTEKYYHSYYAVISGNNITENSGMLLLASAGNIRDGEPFYSIMSCGRGPGAVSSVIIDGKEYARNTCGLNIVVYNNETKHVVDTVCFDTGGDLSASR